MWQSMQPTFFERLAGLEHAHGAQIPLDLDQQALLICAQICVRQFADVVKIAVDALLPAMNLTRRRLAVAFDALGSRGVDLDGLGRLIEIPGVEIFRDRDGLPKI